MLLTLDESIATPKSIQILEQVRNRIQSGVLKVGERLPSTRRLAEQLGVHRSTVSTAYQELWSLGWIELHAGAHPLVRARGLSATTPKRDGTKGFDWGRIASNGSDDLLDVHRSLENLPRKDGCICFRHLDMDRRLLPVEPLRACLNRVMRLHGEELLRYGDPQGYRPLREYIARRMEKHGVSVVAEEILVTNGSQQALDLIFRMLAAPGRTVALESPTYGHVFQLLQLADMKPLEIPMGPEGMDLHELEAKLRKQPPALVYTMPNFQNPTGLSTSQIHREHLLSLCEQYQVPILEDGFEEEMKYFGKVVLPIKSMDRQGIVAYCGTFSKVLFPGIRIGWIAASRDCIERLTALRRFSELSLALPLQAALHEFCERGHYDLHLSRMHRVFRKRMQTVLGALREHIDLTWASWEEPKGGYLIWLKLLDRNAHNRDWTSLFAEHGVQVTSGDRCFGSSKYTHYIRLSIATRDETEITEGIRRLGLALSTVRR